METQRRNGNARQNVTVKSGKKVKRNGGAIATQKATILKSEKKNRKSIGKSDMIRT
jgi:predicted outer membrane repeat protein